MKKYSNNINNKKSFNYIKFIVVASGIFFLFFIILFRFCFNAQEKAEIYYEKGCYQTAAKFYNRCLRIKKIEYLFAKAFLLKNKDDIFFEINDLITDIAFCYSESGDIKKAINFYTDLYNRLNSVHYDEAFCNYIKKQIAVSYLFLGYYDKALPILESLREWYPQNLILAYLYSHNYTKAKKVLFSYDVQDKINEGDDVDAASLTFALWEFYKETGDFDKAKNLNVSKIPAFDLDIIKDIHFADLFFRMGEYEKSAVLYEKLIQNSEFSQKIKNKFKIKLAIVLNAQGKITFAQKILEEVLKSLKESYKYSPDVICTKYYFTKISSDEVFNKKQVLQDFSKLNLTPNSIFYNNVEDFCRINMKY